MPVYEDKKLILVHVIKTGGTSLDSLISGEKSDSEKENVFRRGIEKTKNRLKMSVGIPVLGKHSYAIDYKRALGDSFDTYYKAAFVRNPWDWLVSWYAFVQGAEISPDHGRPWRHSLYSVVSQMSFERYIEWVTQEDGFLQLPSRKASVFCKKRPFLQKDWLVNESGEVIVDFVGRYETINNDALRLLSKYGIDSSGLKIINKSGRTDYKDYYSSLSGEMVAEYFSEDIEFFGYEF